MAIKLRAPHLADRATIDSGTTHGHARLARAGCACLRGRARPHGSRMRALSAGRRCRRALRGSAPATAPCCVAQARLWCLMRWRPLCAAAVQPAACANAERCLCQSLLGGTRRCGRLPALLCRCTCTCARVHSVLLPLLSAPRTRFVAGSEDATRCRAGWWR